MRALALALLLPAAVAAQSYDVSLPAGRVTTVTWNGQPALLIWGNNSSTEGTRIATFSQAYGRQRIGLTIQFGAAIDPRVCAVGNGVFASIGGSSAGGIPLASIPQNGIAIGTFQPSVPMPCGLCDCTHYPPSCRGADPPITWFMSYCPMEFGWSCGGCAPNGFDAPALWALIVTVRLL